MISRKYHVIINTIILILLFFIPSFFNKTYHIMLFDQTFINIITLLGLNFITGLTGQMNLGTAGIFAIGAYTSSLLCVKLGISPWLGLIAAIVMGYLIGIGLGWPSLRIKGIYLALTTLGFGEIIRLLIANMSKFTGGTQGVKGIPFYNLFGLTIGNEREFYYFLLIVTIIMVYFSSRIVNSKWGRAFKAIRDNELAVETCGINISDIKIKAFTLASIYGCIGGALFAHLMGYINPVDFNIDLSVKYLMMLMVGGIGSVPGSIIGAIVVTLLPEYLRFLQNYYWLTFSVILLIFSVLLPNGLISLFDVVVKSVKMKGGGNNANYSSSK